MTRVRHPEAACTGAAAPSRPTVRIGRLDRWARGRLIERLDTLPGAIALRDADGLHRLGRPSGPLDAHLDVIHPQVYRRTLLGGSLGAAVAYIDGVFDCDDLVGMLRVFSRAIVQAPRASHLEIGLAELAQRVAGLAHRLRSNSRRGSRRNIIEHYDLGNDFFATFLDPTMTYSSGLFGAPGATMEEASRAKLDRLCRQLALSPDDHVLEIGTGWGSFAIHAAETYGCRVTTTTISPSQRAFTEQRVRERGLTHRIRVLDQDYRDLQGTFDHAVSIEMIEAVGHRYLPRYFEVLARRVAPGGRIGLQAILIPDERYAAYLRGADFIQRHVFPGASLPSPSAIRSAMAETGVLTCLERFEMTPSYVHTLAHWHRAFLADLDRVRALGADDRFIRLWRFYLAYCEAGFAERAIDVEQWTIQRN